MAGARPASNGVPDRPGDPHVLLMGYRPGIGAALGTAGARWALWNETHPKAALPGIEVRIAPFGRSAEEFRENARALTDAGPFTHVIAGTEAAVVAASHARRVLGARLSTHTTVQRCHDKLAMKLALDGQGIPMTDFTDGNRVREWQRLFSLLGSPVVVKERRRSGGSGIRVVHAGAEGDVSLRNKLVERFVDAPEASVESFVVDGEVVFQNVTEYYRKGQVNVVPGGLDDGLADALRSLSRRVVRALRITWGLTHAEFYCPPGGPLFGEIALRPPGGYIMELMRLAYGFDAWEAFVAVELGLPFAFPEAAARTAAAIVVHPGAGRVTAIEGGEVVRAHPSVTDFRLSVRVGDDVDPRTSVGRSIGHVLLSGADRQAVLAAIADVDATLQIRVERDAGA